LREVVPGRVLAAMQTCMIGYRMRFLYFLYAYKARG